MPDRALLVVVDLRPGRAVDHHGQEVVLGPGRHERTGHRRVEQALLHDRILRVDLDVPVGRHLEERPQVLEVGGGLGEEAPERGPRDVAEDPFASRGVGQERIRLVRGEGHHVAGIDLHVVAGKLDRSGRLQERGKGEGVDEDHAVERFARPRLVGVQDDVGHGREVGHHVDRAPEAIGTTELLVVRRVVVVRRRDLAGPWRG